MAIRHGGRAVGIDLCEHWKNLEPLNVELMEKFRVGTAKRRCVEAVKYYYQCRLICAFFMEVVGGFRQIIRKVR